jgi:alpha-1,2-mannosyltransferase
VVSHRLLGLAANSSSRPRRVRRRPRRRSDHASRLPAPAICALIYCVSIVALLLSHLGQGWGYLDLAVYRYGGEAVLHGSHLYALRFPGALAFTYPPFAAMLFTGLSLPAMALLKPTATAASLILLPLMLSFALRLAPISVRRLRGEALRVALLASAAAIWLEPVWTTLRYGQIDLLIGALVLYDLSRPDSSRWKGAGIGLAMALKLTPAIFALYLLLSRRYRAAAVSVATFCGSLALALVVLPGDSREYWSGAFLDPSRVGRVENAANQSLRGALVRLTHSTNVEALWLCAAVAVGVAGMGMAVAAGRRGEERRGFALCAITGLLVAPVSWSHHWALAVPAFLLVTLEAYRRRWIAGLLACGAVASVAYSHMIWWVPVNRPPHSELHLDALQLVFADAYVLVGVGALALAGWRSTAMRRRRADDPGRVRQGTSQRWPRGPGELAGRLRLLRDILQTRTAGHGRSTLRP